MKRLRETLAELERRAAEGDLSSNEVAGILTLCRDLITRLEEIEGQLTRSRQMYRDISRRVDALENSRIFRTLRWAGSFASDYRRKAGRMLLHSPLHPLYLRWAGNTAEEGYTAWLARHPSLGVPAGGSRPVSFSVLMPVSNPRREWLEAAIESVRRQTWPHWQLAICDDASRESWVVPLIEDAAAADARIVFARAAGPLGISGAINRASMLAVGQYFAFLDHDDLLHPDALACVAAALQNRDYDLVYTDEDRLNLKGVRVQPVFRPDFSPDLLTACMYMGHLLVVSRGAWERAGGMRPEYDGAQDFDLALRVSEFGGGVAHVPAVLYHWRMHEGSTASAAAAKPNTHAAGRRALEDAMRRRGRHVRVEGGVRPNHYRCRPLLTGEPLISIVVCSRNPALLSRCLASVSARTAYPRRQVVVVEHAPMDSVLSGTEAIRVPFPGEFNFSAMNNKGAAAASGEILLFLNDDVQPLAPDWLEWLAGHAQRPEIGAAGPQLLYPRGTVQHAGLALGIMDGAGHPFRGTFGSAYWPWLDCTRNVAAVTGACLAIRKSVFDHLGGFDSAFPRNYNDVDLCLRAREAGFEVVVEPASLLRHDECATRPPGVDFDERDLFFSRWGHWFERGDPFYSVHLTATREDATLRD